MRYKLQILARPGSLQNEADSNRQINDKERIAAAIDRAETNIWLNPWLTEVVHLNHVIFSSF